MRTEYKHNPPIPYSLHDMRVKKIIIQLKPACIAPTMMADFIVPIIEEIRKYVGVQNIVIYAIDEKLVNYYQNTYGFGFLDKEATDYVCENIKPYYDHGGQLMILRLPNE